jgi:hypothetical protein
MKVFLRICPVLGGDERRMTRASPPPYRPPPAIGGGRFRRLGRRLGTPRMSRAMLGGTAAMIGRKS